MAKGYCAGILIFETKSQLPSGELRIHFANQAQVASEICVDVYEEVKRKYRHDLSKAFKR